MRLMRRKNRSGARTGNRLGAVVLGALAGMAVGMLLADRGLLAGAGARKRRTAKPPTADDEAVPENSVRPPWRARSPRRPPNDEAELEARVLETFRNDPILVDRPIDIGAIGTGIIELTGWVDAPPEIRLATTLTRGTIGVHTVVNRLLVRRGTPEA